MKKIILFAVVSTSLWSCNLNTTPENNRAMLLDSLKIARDTTSGLKEFKGLYYPISSSFLNCEDGKTYHLKNNKILDTIFNNILPNAYSGQCVFLKMDALVNPDHPDTIDTPIKSMHLEQKNHKNTCIPYEYWCIGTEPFWTIQISKNEKLIDLYEPMEQKTTHFAYIVPELKNGEITYTATNEHDKIVVIIKKEKCNGAIDAQYDYSAQVQFNDKKLAGCTLKYSENK